jgi:uncharacterized coiled-coil DUF342 family protein
MSEDLDSLDWNGLIALKRQLSSFLREITTKIIKIEDSQIRSLNDNIQRERENLNTLIHRSKQVRAEIHSNNSKLYDTSKKISEAKNFLSMMESRLPPEKEDDLLKMIDSTQKLFDQKMYKNEREKAEIISSLNDAKMKREAIRAVQSIKEQLGQYNRQSETINRSLKLLDEEQQSLQRKISEAQKNINTLFTSRHALANERQIYLKQYEGSLSQLDKINARLDIIAETRKKQRKEYGHAFPHDALLKVKEEAKKKLEKGSKLSLEELKLLYNEKA